MKHQLKNIVFPFSNDLTQRLESIFSGSKIQNLSAFAKTSGNQSVKQKDERMFLWLQKNSKLQYKLFVPMLFEIWFRVPLENRTTKNTKLSLKS